MDDLQEKEQLKMKAEDLCHCCDAVEGAQLTSNDLWLCDGCFEAYLAAAQAPNDDDEEVSRG